MSMIKEIDRMVANHKLIDIVHKCSLEGYSLEGTYRRIQDRDLFLTAYGNIYANKGAMTEGVDPHDTVDGMSIAKIDAIIEKLRNNSYRWKPVRRTYIDKETGGQRPLGIPTWSDKLLQEVIRMILEAYYEPRFSDNSHGFRPERGCHTALQTIKDVWKGTKWFIEGDIKGCFDNIDHNTLMNVLARDIKDNRFLKLIRTMLRAGYMEDWKYHSTYSGTPQGGVVSPILSNIMLNELDKFVEEKLIPEYNQGTRRPVSPEYARISRQMYKARQEGNKELAKELEKLRRKVPSRDPNHPEYRRLRYIRYADDFLLAFAGPKKEAEEIKRRIGEFLETIGLTMSEEKTLITHAATGYARFLNYNISVATPVERKNASYVIQLTIPTDVKTKWMRKYTRKGKTHHRAELLEMSDFEIVQTYGAEFRGIVNYYILAKNVSDVFYPVKHVAMESAIKTLANKHKTKKSRIYRKYAKKNEHGVRALIVELSNPKNPNKPYRAKLGETPIRHKRNTIITDRKWTPQFNRTELVKRLLADTCELCGTQGDVEVHHIRKLANLQKRYKGRKDPPQWVRFLIERRRKTIVVCKDKCHRQIHAGIYDGEKVE
jgi:group II intron reverse transcriptase/maturase